MGELQAATQTRKVLVIGGGPAGMKAAVVAAERGHRVELHEKDSRLGGQVNLAEALPGRAEFGGVTINLQRELERAGVTIQCNSLLDDTDLRAIDLDHVVIATGASTRLPDVEMGDVEIVDAWSVIRGDARAGKNVVIADWSCDWAGLGVAEKLAREGHYVRLLSGGSVAGESIQAIVRDQWIGVLHDLGVEMTPYARYYGALDGDAFFQHMTGGKAIVCEQVDTVVTCYAPQANRECAWVEKIEGIGVSWIGDAVSPRTVEEAVLEGLQLARQL